MLRTVGQKLTAFIGGTIAIGFAGVVGYYAHQQEANILQQNERGIRKLTESVSHGLQTAMLEGYAPVAELFAQRLKQVSGVLDFRILRVSGLEAFKDNETIHKVNEIRGDEDFLPRRTEQRIQVLPGDLPELRRAVETKGPVSFYGELKGERALTFLWPVTNAEDCRKCHGRDHEVRGVIELTTSLSSVHQEIARTWREAGAVLAVSLVLVTVVMTVVLRRSIVHPIEVVSQAMRKVSCGDLAQEVPVLGRDELGQMARSFNAMTQDLRDTALGFRTEQDKLETIIRGSNDGIVVTDAGGRVVLVNRAAEQLLGKSSAEVVRGGFLHLLDDPDHMRARIERASPESDAEIVIYRQRILAAYVAAIRNEAGQLLGQAAMLRDITEEKQMERRLLELSNTDGLTGLANRRCLDESLAREFQRASHHRRSLAVLMLDVDHFKTFNDTYGHDQGDRVLQAVSQGLRECVRNVDMACRYGGEEFTVIATETSLEGGLRLGERIRSCIEDMRVDGLRVTASIGVAGLHECGAGSPEALLELADSALYEAKRGGRNRVVAAPARAAGRAA